MQQILAPPKVRGKAVRIHEVRKRPSQTETEVDVPVPGGVPETVRGAEVPGIEVPGAAPHHAQNTIPTLPGTPVTRCPHLGTIPAILHPFAHVPAHIVDPQIIRLL